MYKLYDRVKVVKIVDAPWYAVENMTDTLTMEYVGRVGTVTTLYPDNVEQYGVSFEDYNLPTEAFREEELELDASNVE